MEYFVVCLLEFFLGSLDLFGVFYLNPSAQPEQKAGGNCKIAKPRLYGCLSGNERHGSEKNHEVDGAHVNSVSNCNKTVSVRSNRRAASCFIRTFFTDNTQVSGEHSRQRSQVLRHEKHHGRLHDCSAERTAHLRRRKHAEAKEPDVAEQQTNNKTACKFSEKDEVMKWRCSSSSTDNFV